MRKIITNIRNNLLYFFLILFFSIFAEIKELKIMARPLKITRESKYPTPQSNWMTTAMYDFSPAMKRIFYRIVEKAYGFREANPELFKEGAPIYKPKRHITFILPIVYFMSNVEKDNLSGKEYNDVVDAFNALTKKDIDFRTPEEFSFGHVLNYADREKGDGNVCFSVHKFVWQVALDFSKGFTLLDIGFAMQLRSAYSMRMYEMCKQWENKGFRSISIENFREEFGCVDKYPFTHDLKRYILGVAKKELDKVSPISFEFEFEKVGRKIVNIHFTFYHTHLYQEPKNPDEKYLLSKDPTNAIPKEMREWLGYKLNISQDQINRNIKLFYDFSQGFAEDTMKELDETFNYMSSKNKRPAKNVGFFINNLKAKLENLQDYRKKAAEQRMTDKTSALVDKFNKCK